MFLISVFLYQFPAQHEDYITSALKSYQKKERQHKTMHANAIALSDEEINYIAKYFESLKWVKISIN